MKLWAVLVTGVLLAACAAGVPAAVYPNLDGATGVAFLPTAEVADPGTINVALCYTPGTQGWRSALARVNAAVGPNLEVWGGEAFWRHQDWRNTQFLNGGLKYRFLSQGSAGIGAAVGGAVGRQTSSDGEIDFSRVFLVVSKDLDVGVPARLTAGGMHGRFDGSGWEGKYTRPYAALELLDVKGCDLAIEYRWRADDLDEKAPWSAVLRYTAPDKPVWVEIGTSNAWELVGTYWGGQRVFFGVGVAFGGE